MRAYKTVNDNYIEPISFTVPRRAETFQSDIFPPAVGSKAGLSAADWISGKTALPPKIDFESIYEGTVPVEVPADYKPPASTPAPAPAPKPAPKEAEPAPAPTPAATRAPPPELKDQKSSIAAMASKYNDKEEEEEDDASSFEEISKPSVRASIFAKPEVAPIKPTKTTTAAPPKPASPIKSPVFSSHQSTATPTPASSSAPTPAVEQSLEQIKQLLENQTKLISVQGDHITHLTAEIDSLKKRVGSGSQDQSERIRQLELELESLKS